MRTVYKADFAVFALAMFLLSATFDSVALAAEPAPLPTVDESAGPEQLAPRHGHHFMFRVTLHSAKEIDSMLTRAETLSHQIDIDKSQSGIALVLHGPEIEIFNKKNYGKYRHIVDKAKRLNAEHIIAVKLCRTKMKELHMRDQDVPSWIEIVPYGPDEEKRLEGLGYTYL